MKQITSFLLLLIVLSTGCVAKNPMPSVPAYDIATIIDSLPDGDRWIRHLNEDLLPFWTLPTALGERVGEFPTYRNNDGSLVNPDSLSPELKAALADTNTAGLIHLDRLYSRAHARQTYAYGIAYHITGEEKYLSYAKAGVDFLRSSLVDRENGGAATYLKVNSSTHAIDTSGKYPTSLQRTSQDLAYALTGIGFYYYLTHDPEMLGDIFQIKNHIFETYFDEELGLFKWLIEDNKEDGSAKQKELVSQLDQVYAYMLWLTPSLPEPHRAIWTQDLKKIAHLMMSQFFSEKYGFFWGAITDSKSKQLGKPHTDFGHSIKTLWLIYQIGKMTNEIELINFAKENATKLIDIAYIPKTASWGRRFDKNGKFDSDKEWWGLAELDQVTATLSLVDPSYARYLLGTYDYWFTYMVDKSKHADGTNVGGIWHMVDAKTNKPVLEYPKQHSWKNSLHTFEHALIGYITTQELKQENIILHFAFKTESGKDHIHPYFYEGKIKGINTSSFTKIPELQKYTVTFTDLR